MQRVCCNVCKYIEKTLFSAPPVAFSYKEKGAQGEVLLLMEDISCKCSAPNCTGNWSSERGVVTEESVALHTQSRKHIISQDMGRNVL